MYINKFEIVNAAYTHHAYNSNANSPIPELRSAQTPPVRNIPAPNLQLQQHIGDALRDPKLKRREIIQLLLS
jgi:hypothetical protein